jgi:hypothetical protein
MSKHGLWIGCVTILLFLCGALYFGSDWLCKQDDILADLDPGNNRYITISAESCWEVGRALYYEVKEYGTIVSPKSFFDADSGDRHSYSLIYAENKSLVGVLDSAPAPVRVAAIYDFTSGDTWPRRKSYETGVEESYIQRRRDLFQRLQQENPGMIIPLYYR